MSRPVVIDANAFKEIYEGLLAEDDSMGRNVVETVLKNDHIVLDEDGKMRHEWKTCSCGEADEFLSMWIAQRIIEDKVREVSYKVDARLKSKMNNFGMPNNDR